MVSWRLILALGALATAVLITSCGGSATSSAVPTAMNPTPAQAVYTPLTIESCATTTGSDADIGVGQISLTYNEAPSRAITLNQHATEIMLALGLEDRMIGTAYIDDQILPKYLTAYNSIPILAEEYPSKEVILAQEPDFVYGGFSSSFGNDVAGSQDALKGLGIGSYLTAAICEESADTLEDVYTDIRNIGRIFGVSDRAEVLVASLRQDVANVESILISSPTIASETPLRVFIYDSGDDAPYTASCCSMFTTLIETVGGVNIFADVNGRWSTVNWEEVIARDPEVIVLTEAVWSTSQEKIDLLLSNPAYTDITAVKEQRFVVLQFTSLVPGVRNPAAIRKLAEGIYPDRFP